MTEAKVLSLRPPASEQLALAVRAARKAAGLSLLKASIDVKVDLRSIKSWERGEARPDVAKLLDAPRLGPAFAAELAKLAEARRAA
jgi:transcriptional regulator with XRE-family HTH domain